MITIFSQFGEPVFLKLVRDRDTGKSKGFGWLKYEDQRSTDLAVDNLGGATIGGRMVKVDHARYKPRDDDDPEEGKVGWLDIMQREGRGGEGGGKGGGKGDADGDVDEMDVDRPLLEEEKALMKLIDEHDDEDPMKAFLVEEAKQAVEQAKQREAEMEERKERKHRHHKHRSHRSRREDEEEESRGSERDPSRRERRRRDDEGGEERRRPKDRASRRDEERRHDRDRGRDEEPDGDDFDAERRRNDRERERRRQEGHPDRGGGSDDTSRRDTHRHRSDDKPTRRHRERD